MYVLNRDEYSLRLSFAALVELGLLFHNLFLMISLLHRLLLAVG